MTRWVRAQALLLLALFGGVGIAAPLADAALYHADATHHAGAHIEQAGADCHAESCAVGAPASPVHRAITPGSPVARTTSATRSVGPRAGRGVRDRRPSRRRNPRAPPA